MDTLLWIRMEAIQGPWACMLFCDFVYTIQFFLVLLRIRKSLGQHHSVQHAAVIAKYGFVTSLCSVIAASIYAIELATQQELRAIGVYSVLMLVVYLLILFIVISLSLQKRELDRGRINQVDYSSHRQLRLTTQ